MCISPAMDKHVRRAQRKEMDDLTLAARQNSHVCVFHSQCSVESHCGNAEKGSNFYVALEDRMFEWNRNTWIHANQYLTNICRIARQRNYHCDTNLTNTEEMQYRCLMPILQLVFSPVDWPSFQTALEKKMYRIFFAKLLQVAEQNSFFEPFKWIFKPNHRNIKDNKSYLFSNANAAIEFVLQYK